MRQEIAAPGVMAELVPAIHVVPRMRKSVDARVKPTAVRHGLCFMLGTCGDERSEGLFGAELCVLRRSRSQIEGDLAAALEGF